MEFLKASRRKSLLSEIVHALLNITLAAALFALVATGSWLLAISLVLVSKWRILAVRPRYWWANILANIVDLTVSLGTVALLYLAGTSGQYGLMMQAAVTALYALWLIALKPRSKQVWIKAQAIVGLLIGSWALLALAHAVPFALVLVVMYIVAYGAARHVLISREEDQPSLLSMVFGLLVAEITWVVYHWTVAYGVDAMAEFKLPQGTIVIVLLAFLVERIYAVQSSGKSLRSIEIIAPLVFVVLIIAVLAFVFSSGAGII